MAERWYGRRTCGDIERRVAALFIDFVYQAQVTCHQRKLATSLPAASTGVPDLQLGCHATDANSSVVYLYGFSDNATYFDIYRDHVKNGSIVIDVGANLGIHTLVLSNCVGERGRVFAYEPVPSLYQRLQANLELNHITNVTARNYGLGDQPGMGCFHLYPDRFNIGHARVDPEGSASIRLSSIDDDLAGIDGQVSLIKIDVEGYELAVINGAQRTLERHRPAIVLEYNPEWCRFGELMHSIPFEARCWRVPTTHWERLLPLDATYVTSRLDVLVMPAVERRPDVDGL